METNYFNEVNTSAGYSLPSLELLDDYPQEKILATDEEVTRHCDAIRLFMRQHLIENAEIIEKTEMDAGVVNLSSRVKLLDIDENEEVEYKIVGSQEANPMQGRISDESPIGRAILGRRVGETVTVDAPAGQMRFTVLEVAHD